MAPPAKPSLAGALSLAPGPRGEALLLAFREPRTTLLAQLRDSAPAVLALAVSGILAENATLVLFRTEAKHHRALRNLRPEAEILFADPASLRRFFWNYRDAHDPMALGHASERTLFGPEYATRPIPRPGSTPGRRERTREGRRLRELVLDTGSVLGVRPPLPDEDDPSWGRRKREHLNDTALALYAALLHRWNSPLAKVDADGSLSLA